MPVDFPSAKHVEALRKALWRPRSRAAVMVGAGFSRNADAITSAAPPFPLWGDITRRLKADLESETTDPLRLGEEYQQWSSRTALDDLLLEMIPDSQYQPGRLHEMLLSLPWSDVFTTNYDTLIERTRPKVHAHKYDLVLTAEDIARSERPRIVKLHGSFPSHRPFLFTAEDYRKYPKDFAPFVNMVQQSIMENFFCMIGFSGNDPNFLQWLGWVRDQLGTAAPKIYLCDVLDLNPAKERLYQSMHVIPIDLGSIVPRSTWTSELRWRKALEWFLASLHQGRPLDVSGWPDAPSTTRSPYPVEEPLPSPIAPPAIPSWVLSPAPEKVELEKMDRDALKRLAKHWQEQREGYPGWIIMPEANRALLLRGTERWLQDTAGAEIVKVLDASPLEERTGFLHELVWRIRRSLVPLPSWLRAAAKALLERFNPKPDLLKLKGLATEPEIPSKDLDSLTTVWVELAFALLNDAWQDGCDSEFNLWMERLEKLVRLKPEWQSQWYYEQGWYHLIQLNESALRSVLKNWPAQNGLPFWEAKRAALHAECGDVGQALSIAEAALERVRQGTRPGSIDYFSLSTEGWIIDLIRLLDRARMHSPRQAQAEFTSRLRTLRSHHCDPNEDGERREKHLLRHEVGVRMFKERGFDPGAMSQTTRLQVWRAGEWVLFQTFHDGTWPLHSNSWASGLAESMVRIWQHSPRLAIAMGLLGRKQEELSKLLGRVDVAALVPQVARSLYDWLSAVFLKAMDSKCHEGQPSETGDGLRERLLAGCPEILSRLTLHLLPEQRDLAFDLTLKMYAFEPFLSFSGRYSRRVEAMFRRVLFAAPVEQLHRWLPRLLSLPLVGEEGFLDENKQWPEPTEFVPWESMRQPPSDEERTSYQEALDRLIDLVQIGPPELRKRASLRLARVARWGGMTEKQGKRFVGALWSRPASAGLPEHLGFEPWELLDLPYERQPGESKKAVSRYLLEEDSTGLREYLDWIHETTAHAWQEPARRKVRIAWTSSEAESLLRKVLRLWARKKPSARPVRSILSDPLRERRLVQSLSGVLGSDILPFLSPEAGSSLDAVRGLIAECRQLGFSALEALPALLIFDTSRAAETAQRILHALRGSGEEEVSEAIRAIFDWVALARSSHVVPPPSRLMDEWIALLVSRRQPGLSFALKQLISFLECFGDELKEHHLDGLREALGYLAEETQLPSTGQISDELPLTPEDRIELRGHASVLAASLAGRYHHLGGGIPPEIEAWRNIGTTDTLPEVRRAWQKVQVPPSA